MLWWRTLITGYMNADTTLHKPRDAAARTDLPQRRALHNHPCTLGTSQQEPTHLAPHSRRQHGPVLTTAAGPLLTIYMYSYSGHASNSAPHHTSIRMLRVQRYMRWVPGS